MDFESRLGQGTLKNPEFAEKTKQIGQELQKLAKQREKERKSERKRERKRERMRGRERTQQTLKASQFQ